MEVILFVPLIAVVVEVLKKVIKLESNFVPVLALVVGIVLNYFAKVDILDTGFVINGVALALMSQGLYSQIKKGKNVLLKR